MRLHQYGRGEKNNAIGGVKNVNADGYIIWSSTNTTARKKQNKCSNKLENIIQDTNNILYHIITTVLRQSIYGVGWWFVELLFELICICF